MDVSLMETIDDFMNRINVNFIHDIVFVYPSKQALKLKSSKLKVERWNTKQAREYITYLRENENKDKVE